MTGAPLPAGADAVLPVENTELDGATVLAPAKSRRESTSARRRGRPSGRRRPVRRPCTAAAGFGVLSSIGVAEIPVVRRPRVRILITGNELLPTGTAPAGCQIADANGPMLAALVARDGGDAGLPRHHSR